MSLQLVIAANTNCSR